MTLKGARKLVDNPNGYYIPLKCRLRKSDWQSCNRS